MIYWAGGWIWWAYGIAEVCDPFEDTGDRSVRGDCDSGETLMGMEVILSGTVV